MSLPPVCHDEIINGIELLLAARLRWAPVQPEDIERTGAAWLVAVAAAPVAWDDQRDPPRIRQAFARLAGTALEWPAPAAMLAMLPPLLPPLALAHKRAPPSAAARARLAEINQRIKNLSRERGLNNHLNRGIK